MKMDQFYYLITIIENNFNITASANILHISQSALSHMINKLEKEENIRIFERSKNRLVGLTPTGKIVYDYSKQLWNTYLKMSDMIQRENLTKKETLVLGLPPVIISHLFDEVLPHMILDNPNINFITIEYGAVRLKKMFLNKEIPIVALLSPTGMDKNKVEEVLISNDMIYAYVGENHPCADKKFLTYNELKTMPLALLNDSHMTHHILKNQFNLLDIKPNLKYESSSIELLINSSRNSNFVTVLPGPVSKQFRMDGIKKIPFKPSLDWDVVLCRHKQKEYAPVEDYVFNYMVQHAK